MANKVRPAQFKLKLSPQAMARPPESPLQRSRRDVGPRDMSEPMGSMIRISPRRLAFLVSIGLVCIFIVGFSVGMAIYNVPDGVERTNFDDTDTIGRVSADPFVLRVMTFNLRDFDDEVKENFWADRRDHVAEIINHYRPVVLGTQEGVLDQLDDLHDVVMPQYERFGDARETGSEYVQVFYDTNVVELLNGSTFWISETPNEAESIGWDAAFIRIATWCQFRLRATQQEFFYVNTQLDNEGKTARLNGAKVIWGEMKNLIPNTDKTPLFFTGDLNDMRPSDTYQFLTTDPAGPLFYDAWSVAEHPIGSVSNSYHDWLGPSYDKTKHIDWIDPSMDHPDVPGANHIDFILSRPRLPVIMTEVITETLNGQYPSDHYPIVAEYLFPSASKLPPPSN